MQVFYIHIFPVNQTTLSIQGIQRCTKLALRSHAIKIIKLLQKRKLSNKDRIMSLQVQFYKKENVHHISKLSAQSTAFK